MENLAKYIEHTVISAVATVDDIKRACQDVEKYGFGGICVNSCYVALAAHLLQGNAARIISTCGFSQGCVKSEVKVLEARLAVADKADEIDMVMNLSAAKSGNWAAVADDIRAVVEASGVPVKVIIETELLTADEKMHACQAIIEGGGSCVKTCSGTLKGGVTINDVKLFKELGNGKFGVTAAGGIRTKTQAIELIEAGALRLGTSTGPFLLAVGR